MIAVKDKSQSFTCGHAHAVSPADTRKGGGLVIVTMGALLFDAAMTAPRQPLF